jgi:hypothetical protein
VMHPGDMFVMRTGGGGGWGNPFERDPERVRRDVGSGLLTVQQARDWYGVVVEGTPPKLNVDATEALRAESKPFEGWIDRGVPVATPGPNTYWSLDESPHPWLAIRRAAFTKTMISAD